MSIGMWTYKENERRLDRIEKALRAKELPDDERAELETDKRELQAWFRQMEEQ